MSNRVSYIPNRKVERMILDVASAYGYSGLVTTENDRNEHGAIIIDLIFVIYNILGSQIELNLTILQKNEWTYTLVPGKIPWHEVWASTCTIFVQLHKRSDIKLIVKVWIHKHVASDYLWITVPDVIFLPFPIGLSTVNRFAERGLEAFPWSIAFSIPISNQ